MAIKIESQPRGGFGKLIGVLAILAILGIATYYLFFAPTPVIEYIVPVPLQEANQLSNFALDPNVVLKSPEFTSLGPIGGLPTGGSFGRSNPFVSF